MTTANPEDVATTPRTRAPLGSGLLAGWRSVREALDKPLASYYLLLGSSALLLTIGLIMVLSASSVRSYLIYDDSYAVVKRQLMWVAIGLPAAWVASRMPVKHVRRLAYPGFLVTLVLLGLVARFGVLINGNKNWLALGPVNIQPAEIAKLAIVLWAANIYAHKERRLRELHHLLVPVVPGLFAVIGLVLVGRDLGTAMVLAAILLGMLWVVGAPMRLFGLSLSVLGVAAVALAATDPERLERITHFTDPFKDYTDAGWQPAHGLFALSSGGWFGQGIGGSTQKWGDLPEAHTDFIFAVLGEELGLVGTLLVVGLFFTIAYAAIRVALAVLPVIGIPLPIVSYGGSALLPSLMALGLVIGFARREPEAAAALAARRRDRSAGLSAGPSSPSSR
jgi:cell division protein FtsW